MYQTEFPSHQDGAAPAGAGGYAGEAEFVPAPAVHTLPFKFHGSASEYFGIWIVNLLLSVLTLGIYSAWAKVRNQRYFYGNTELAGSRFEYHGQPLAILKGRLIALALLAPYTILSQTHPAAALGSLLLLFLASPWLIVRTLRFRMHYTSYRNLRFAFVGTTGKAFKYFIALPVLGLLSLGLALPWVQHEQRRFLMNNARYGQSAFQMPAMIGKWYSGYLIAVGAMMAAFTLLMLALVLIGGLGYLAGFGKDAGLIYLIGAGVFVYFMSLPIYAVGGQTLLAWLANEVWNASRLDEARFASTMRVSELIKLYLGNFFALIFSLGLALPWVRVRTLRYRLDHLAVLMPGGIEGFNAAVAKQEAATGEEVADFFDIDIAL